MRAGAKSNIEAAYAAKMGAYAAFENLCFVTTFDNIEGLNVHVKGELGGMSVENARRIKEQNKRKISVVIGNQQNETLNPNRSVSYPMLSIS